MRFEFEESGKTFCISVRELAEDRRFYPIGSDRGEGWGVLREGGDLHSRVLKARQAQFPGYRAEVFLQARVPVEDWTAIVTGRLDGCFEQEGEPLLIEEFKSAFFGPRGFHPAQASHERYMAQLMIYCHLSALLGRERVAGALVYVDVATGREAVFPFTYDRAACEREFQIRLRALLNDWRAEGETRRVKRALAPALPFPHAAPRPGQERLILEIGETIAAREQLLAEAPTGSGKTAASLHPALQAGLLSGRQVVFLTAKTLQQTMAVKALQGMNAEGLFRTAQIRSKERMCANGQVLCHEDFCPFARNFPEKMESSGVLEKLVANHPHFDPDTVFAEARQAEVCPFEVQLELAQRADAIVADYNYVFEPAAALRHLSGDGLGHAILLVDEAHNLPDRARNIFSPAVLEEELQSVYQDCLNRPGALFERLAQMLEEWLALLSRQGGTLPEGEGVMEISPRLEEVQRLFEEWEAVFFSYLGWKRENKVMLPEDGVVALHFTLLRFAAVMRLFGPGFACTIERREKRLRLRLLCLDPSRAVAPILRSAHAVILLSATLSPPEIFEKSLGLDPRRVRHISLPPPFPRENRKILILPQVRTSYKARDKNYRPIAELISSMAGAHPANYLALFPSYAFLTGVSALLGTGGPRVIAQRPNLPHEEREQILRTLKSPPAGGVLLLAVLGGMYAEGVDYPGGLLSGVFVVSPALPQVSFERELLRRYYEEQDEPGFDYAYLQPGMTRVVQAAGRLIRGETDRGVIALLCARFLEEPYRDWLPPDWFIHTPFELTSRDPAGEIQSFFEPDGKSP